MLPEIPDEQLAAELDSIALDTLMGEGVDHPPVDAFEIARGMRLAVAWDDRQRGRARCVRLGPGVDGTGRPAILLRPDDRRERLQWAVAHEIGEQLASQVFGRLGIDAREADPSCREQLANLLASRLLLPGEWFVTDGTACGWDLRELKARYATASHELIARRMLDCSPPVIITIFDQGQVTFRRSNVSGRVPPLSAGEEACWRKAHDAAHDAAHDGAWPSESGDGLGEIRAWPVHEAQWKREILRTELADVFV